MSEARGLLKTQFGEGDALGTNKLLNPDKPTLTLQKKKIKVSP